MESVIALHNVSKVFKEEPGKRLAALERINLEIAAGEFFVFLGPSGSGKSTLLRIMSGLEPDFAGSTRLGSGIRREDISFVFQQFALLPWLTVARNITLGLIAREVPLAARSEIAARELKRFGLEKFAEARPRELSGGMRQRVGLARALATDPKVIFMDEPFSELDSFTAEELRAELLAIWQERHLTIVMVTHLVTEAIELADRIAVLTPHPGRIERIVPNPLLRPRQKRSLAFYELEDQLRLLIQP